MATDVLERFEADPKIWREPLVEILIESGAATDRQTLELAREFMAELDATGSASGTYAVDARGAHGVQIGQANVQFNTFSVPPRNVR